MSRRGICHIWFRGRHISPSMPYREARSVAERSEGPNASKSDRYNVNKRIKIFIVADHLSSYYLSQTLHLNLISAFKISL